MNDAFSASWPLFLWAQQSTFLGLPTRQWWIWAAWLILGFFGLFPGIVAYMVWAERKVAARFQDRIGPNRVGPLGLLQPIADAIKLLTKENIVPRTADQWVHLLAPVLLLVSAFLTLAVIPFGYELTPVHIPSGLLYLIAVSSLSSIAVFLAGWASRNKYALLGAMRAVAQLVSYEIPQVLATVPIILWTGSLSLVAIVDAQALGGWNLLSPPGLLAFGLLTIANIAEVNRTPFDLPEAESEIIAGYHTEYSGMRFGLFFLAEYLSVFAVSCLGTVLFLGGGHVPGIDITKVIGGTTWPAYLLTNLIMVGTFLAKVLLYVFLMFWIRATLPRMRVDRLMAFAWKVMIPLSLFNIVLATIWFEWVIRPVVHRPASFLWFFTVDLTYWSGCLVTGLLAILAFGALVRIAWASRTAPTLEGKSPAAPPATAAAR